MKDDGDVESRHLDVQAGAQVAPKSDAHLVDETGRLRCVLHHELLALGRHRVGALEHDRVERLGGEDHVGEHSRVARQGRQDRVDAQRVPVLRLEHHLCVFVLNDTM